MEQKSDTVVTPIEAFNSVRHGLRARTIVIPGLEDPDEWDNFRDEVVASLLPEGRLENELASCVAECAWRRRRVGLYEAQLVDVERRRVVANDGWQQQKKKLLADDAAEPEGSRDEIEVLRRAARDFYGDMHVSQALNSAIKPEPVLPPGEELERIMRYESHITRQQNQALHELQALQARRRGEAAPLARISVLHRT